VQRDYDPNSIEDKNLAAKTFDENEAKLTGMEKRAQTAEIILGMVIVFILNCMCFSFFKIHNQKKREDS